jgi:hypothetical protein
LFPFLDGKSSLKGPGKIPPCLLTKILILTKAIQILLHPTLATVSSGDEERWPEGGSISYNTILQLDRFCKKEGKWTEVPYIQLFFFLRDHPEWLSKCRLDTQTMVTVCKKSQTLLRNQNQNNHLMLHELPLSPLTQLPHTPDIVLQDSTPPVNFWRA